MTFQNVTEAIAARLGALWVSRPIYRNFCPADFQRPSSFLVCVKAEPTDAGIGLISWTATWELELFAARDKYDESSLEELQADQAAVLDAFAASLVVGNRYLLLTVFAEGGEFGSAFVRFSGQWMDQRPGYRDAEAETPASGGAPLMYDYTLDIQA